MSTRSIPQEKTPTAVALAISGLGLAGFGIYVAYSLINMNVLTAGSAESTCLEEASEQVGTQVVSEPAAPGHPNVNEKLGSREFHIARTISAHTTIGDELGIQTRTMDCRVHGTNADMELVDLQLGEQLSWETILTIGG